MFIYNITTHVAHSIKEVWLDWMEKKHIPEIMQKECFVKYQICKVLEIDETEGVTYAIQFYAESKAQYNRYIEMYATALREDAVRCWGNKTIGFRSLMELIS